MFTSMEIRKRRTKVGQLTNGVSQLGSQNEQLRRELIKFGELHWPSPPNLQYANDYLQGEPEALTYEQTKAKLEADASYQRNQLENMAKLLAFHRKELELEEVEKQSMLDQIGYGYQYLRAQWVQYRRASDKVELDDRLDRLNKAVAMMRSKTHQKLGEVRAETLFGSQQLQSSETIQEIQRKLEGVCMQREDLSERLAQAELREAALQEEHRKVTDQLSRLRQRLKNIQNKYLQSCKKNLEQEEVTGQLHFELSRLKRHRKLVYVNHLEDWTLEVRGQFVAGGQRETGVHLKKLMKFLQEAKRSSQENIEEEPKLKEGVSERVLEPLRVFASNASIGEDKDSDSTPVRVKQPSKTSTNIKLVKESPAQHIQRRQLSRQNSQDILRAGSTTQVPQSILKRAPNFAVASAAKLTYIRQPSRDKNSEIEKSFYVRFENLGSNGHT